MTKYGVSLIKLLSPSIREYIVNTPLVNHVNLCLFLLAFYSLFVKFGYYYIKTYTNSSSRTSSAQHIVD